MQPYKYKEIPNIVNVKTYFDELNELNKNDYEKYYLSGVDIFDKWYHGSLTEQICDDFFDDLTNQKNFDDELIILKSLTTYKNFFTSMKLYIRSNFIFKKNHLFELQYIMLATKLFHAICFEYYKRTEYFKIDIDVKFDKIKKLYQECMNLHIQNLSNIHEYNNKNKTIHIKPFSWQHIIDIEISEMSEIGYLKHIINKYPELFNKNSGYFSRQ